MNFNTDREDNGAIEYDNDYLKNLTTDNDDSAKDYSMHL